MKQLVGLAQPEVFASPHHRLALVQAMARAREALADAASCALSFAEIADELLAVLEELTPAAFERSWTDGEQMSFADGVDAAIAACSSMAGAVGAEEPVDAIDPTALTPRETEVLRLLAEGLSDREIAEGLFLSPRTVGGYVTRILTKLELDSRTAAAVYAVRHDLA